MISTTRPIVITALDLTMAYTFHLTGSRHFGTHTHNSDWDFFTQDSPEVIVFLEQLGFRKVKVSNYGNLVGLYRHLIDNVEVQLVDDVELKKEAQRMIKYFILAIPRAHHQELWNAAFTTIQVNKETER